MSVARREVRELHVPPQLDWDYVLDTARANGLLPLLQKHLSNAASGVLPGHVLSSLKREAVANLQSMLHLVGKQLRVYKLFQEQGIPVAIFKGALLAQMAYGEISLRHAGDIDLLI
ncbi:MAG TPA: nucleotidyltransferase family protein, partial [Pyrinomonadaceae bacterium]|nr:nucleotidyltransferase family protein [Pyrinomonadaceae bacterium]